LLIEKRMIMKVKMRKDRVLLIQADAEKTASGIQMSMDEKERDIREVLAVGEGVEDIKPGDKVLVNHLTVKEIEIQGDFYGVCLQEAIYGIIGQGVEIPERKKAPSMLFAQERPKLIY